MPSEPVTSGQIFVDEPMPGQVRAALSGNLDLLNAQPLSEELRALLSRERPRVLMLDASGVDFCDCSALQMLLDVHDEGQRLDARVVISRASPAIERLLRLFDLTGLFGYPTAGPAGGESIG